MSRLVRYSISLGGHRDGVLLWQLEASIRSLRRFNAVVPIRVAVFGRVSPTLERRLAFFGATVEHHGVYRRRLAELSPRSASVLVEHPTVHRFLDLEQLPADVDEVLLLDCDTIFFDDVERLFAVQPEAECCAREEVYCSRSPAGYDQTYLDEELLARIAGEGGVVVPPFNTGVLLLRGRAISALGRLQGLLLDYLWRFIVWMALNPVSPDDKMRYGEGCGVELLRRRFVSLARAEDALPFPCVNRWIVDEVALWLTLGAVPGLRVADFSLRDVLQDGELTAVPASDRSCVVCHYFSRNTEHLESEIRAAMGEGESKAESVQERPSISARANGAWSRLMSSPVMSETGGVVVYDDLLTDQEFWDLYSEAAEYYPRAGEDVYFGPPIGRDRTAVPPRRFRNTGGGPVQSRLFGAEWLQEFLSDECGFSVLAPNSGTYSYYTRSGDFIGLHLDRDLCDLVLITMLHDGSTADDPAGSIVVHPQHAGQPLSTVSQSQGRRGLALKPRVGQSVLLFGGVVPHSIAPVRDAQDRVISVCCFQARP